MVLTETDLSLNLGCLKLLSKIFLIPLELCGGKVVAFQKKKLCVWLVVMGLSQLNIMKAAVSLFLKLIRERVVPLGSFSLNFLFIVPCECCLGVAAWSLLMWPEVATTIFSSCLHVSRSSDGASSLGLDGFARRHTLQELLTIYGPVLWYPAGVILMAVKIFFDTWPETEGLPLLFRVFLVALDTLGFFTCLTCAYLVFLYHILFKGKIHHSLEFQKKNLG